MAGVFYYDGTDNDNLAITNDENLMYHTGGSTPNTPFGAVLTGPIRYPTQIKIKGVRDENHLGADLIPRIEYELVPVQSFGDIHGPERRNLTNTGIPRFQFSDFTQRPFLWKYFQGWRFNVNMPANTALSVSNRSETWYVVPAGRLTASTSYYPWPANRRGSGGWYLFIPDRLAIPKASGITFSTNTTVATYVWSDTQ